MFHIDVDNSIVCDCDLAWLIRDKRELLTRVYGGLCSNGVAFEDLDPQTFADCPNKFSLKIHSKIYELIMHLYPAITSLKKQMAEAFQWIKRH